MRWTILILNLLAAVGLVVFAAVASAAQRTHAFSTYRELVSNQALVEKPTYTSGEPLNVEARLRGIGSGMSLTFLGYLAAGACLLNGFIFFFAHPVKHHDHDA